MKIVIKFDDPGLWPAQFCNQNIEVEIASVRLPDGVTWSCLGYPVTLVTEALSVPIHDGTRVQTIDMTSLIGGSPKKISIEF